MTHFISIFIMGGIAVVLGVILVILDRYLADYGECSIRINNDTTFTVAGGESLLSYLFHKRIFIPSACGGKGTCGFCKLVIQEGGGPVLPTEIPFLTKKEILSNVRLACQVKVKSNIRVIIPEDYLSIQEFTAVVTGSRSLTYDTREITLKLIEPSMISFKPGQYIQFFIPGTSEYRAYTIASAPGRGDTIQLVVRLVPGGRCSTYMHKSLQIGDSVSFTGPYGDFYLREDTSRDILCAAGGCGLTALASIIRYLFGDGTTRNVTCFFGVQTNADLFYIEEFQKLAEEHENFRFIVALSAPEKRDKWAGETGLIHHVVDKHLEDGENVEAYLCGPPAMIDAVVRALTSKGIRAENIFFDKF